MRKLILALAILFSTTFISCTGNKVANDETVIDSTEVVTDSIEEDSLLLEEVGDTISIDTIA